MPNIVKNQVFIQNYYLYTYLKQEILSQDDETDSLSSSSFLSTSSPPSSYKDENGPKEKYSKEKKYSATIKMYHHFFSAVQECFSQIVASDDGYESFLSWFRWNKDYIEIELLELKEFFGENTLTKGNSDLSWILESIPVQIEALWKSNFEFSGEEMGRINECAQVLNKLKKMQQNGQRNQPKLITTAAEHFRQYLSLLLKKQKCSHFPPKQSNLEDLEKEAKFIISRLEPFDQESAGQLQNDWKQFYDYTFNDTAFQASLDNAIADAIAAEHRRANATALETMITAIQQSINEINQKLNDAVSQASQITTAFLKPLLHPIESLKDLWYFITHPIESGQKLLAWAEDHPVKAGLLICGGLTVGLLAGAAVAAALVFVPPVVGLMSAGAPLGVAVTAAIASAPIAAASIDVAVGAGLGLAIAASMVAVPSIRMSGDIARTHAKADKEMQIEKAKQKKIETEIDDEAKTLIEYEKRIKVSQRALLQQKRRLEQEANRFLQAQQKTKEIRRAELNTRTPEQLQAAKTEQETTLQQLLGAHQQALKEYHGVSSSLDQTADDIEAATNGRIALGRLLSQTPPRASALSSSPLNRHRFYSSSPPSPSSSSSSFQATASSFENERESLIGKRKPT